MFINRQLCTPYLKIARGSIVNIGSGHATATSPGLATYAVSKAGLVGLTKNMAIEFSNNSIRVNCVSPGAVDTMMLRTSIERNVIDGDDTDQKLFKMGRNHLVGRIGHPSDIAEMCYFLADDSKSEFITGSNFVVDGGVTCKLSSEN